MLSPESIEQCRLALSPEEFAELIELSLHAPPIFCDPLFAEQAGFIIDPVRFKVLLTPRRAGKSIGLVRMMLKVAEENPGCNVLYIALTRESAKKAIWKDGLKDFVPLLGMRGAGQNNGFNETDLTWTHENGSVIYVVGADASAKVKERIRGGKFKLIVVDESASFAETLQALVVKILHPALTDQRGTLVLAGTPGDFHIGLFFDLTSTQNPASGWNTWTLKDASSSIEWKGYCWDTTANPYTREQHLEEIKEMKRVNPLVEETAAFQQEKLGRWTVDDKARVYLYDTKKNNILKVPTLSTHVLAVDLGYEDDTAFVLGGWREEDPILYGVESWKRKNMVIPEVAVQINAFRQRFQLQRIIIDGSAKQAVETIRRMYNVPLTAAEKTEKWEHIQILNGDLKSERVKLGPETEDLKRELLKLARDPNSLLPREKPGMPNHLCDCLLYLHRHAHHYLAKVPVKALVVGSPEWMLEQARSIKEEVRMRNEARIHTEREEAGGWSPFGQGSDIGEV